MRFLEPSEIELWELAKKATQGTWRIEFVSDAGWIIIGVANYLGGWDHVASVPTNENTPETGTFISKANPLTVSALLETLEKTREALRDLIGDCTGVSPEGLRSRKAPNATTVERALEALSGFSGDAPSETNGGKR